MSEWHFQTWLEPTPPAANLSANLATNLPTNLPTNLSTNLLTTLSTNHFTSHLSLIPSIFLPNNPFLYYFLAFKHLVVNQHQHTSNWSLEMFLTFLALAALGCFMARLNKSSDPIRVRRRSKSRLKFGRHGNHMRCIHTLKTQ